MTPWKYSNQWGRTIFEKLKHFFPAKFDDKDGVPESRRAAVSKKISKYDAPLCTVHE